MNKSREEVSQLPKIGSQKRIHTAMERKKSQNSLYNRPASNNRSMKRTLSSTNTCKAYKYETTGAMYAKKIEELEKQSILIDNEMKKVQEEINQIRMDSMKKKRQDQFIGGEKESRISGNSAISQSKLSYRKNINVNDAKTLTNEIKISENKIKIMRKKIDENLERNKKLRNQIDVSRKQIFTLKNLSNNLKVSLDKTTAQFNELVQFSTTLDQEIADRNTLMHRTKVESMHRKGQIIKQYDNILKKLDQELEGQKLAKNGKQSVSITEKCEDSRAFYVTQLNMKQKKKQIDENMVQLSPKRKKLSTFANQAARTNQINALKERLQKYQKQFEQLKNHTGTKNADQITKKFLTEYEKNFDFYKYINEVYRNLEEVQQIQEQLLKKKDEILEQMSARQSDIKHEQIVAIETHLSQKLTEKNKEVKIAQDYEQIYNQLKEGVKDFYERIWMKDRDGLNPQQINENNLSMYLEDIRLRINDLNQKYQGSDDKNDQFPPNPADLDQMLEIIKKENGQQGHTNLTIGSDKLMTREDFLKSRQNVFRKKIANNSSRKNFAKK